MTAPANALYERRSVDGARLSSSGRRWADCVLVAGVVTDGTRFIPIRGVLSSDQAALLANTTAPGAASSGLMIKLASILNPASRIQSMTVLGGRW